MSKEPPESRAAAVQLFPGKLRRAGLWCYDCLLPSGFRQVIHVGRPDSETAVIMTHCTNDPTHTRIEEI
jgi:hypothetical protein